MLAYADPDQKEVESIIGDCLQLLNDLDLDEQAEELTIPLMPFQNNEMEGSLSVGTDGIFVMINIESCHRRKRDRIQTCVRAMVDTGSTYNIISLQCLMRSAVIKNPFAGKSNSLGNSNSTANPILVLGDGTSKVRVLGKVTLHLTFRSNDFREFEHQEPFYVLDYPVPHGVILGHQFFRLNIGFDLSYAKHVLNLRGFIIPWAKQGSGENLSILMELPGISLIPPRTTTIITILVTDLQGKAVCNQFGTIENIGIETLIQLPVLSFGFTSVTGHIRIPVTNFEFTSRAIQGYIAIFTSEDPRCHNYYYLSKVTGTVERKDVQVCELKDERESKRKRERGRDNSLGDRTPDIPITTVPVFREGLSRETTSHPPPKDSKILDCNEHIIITDTAHQLTSDTDLSLFDIHQGLADSDSGNFVNQLSGTTISRVAFPNAESLINQEHPPRTQQDVSLQSTHLGNLELTEPPRKKLGMTSRLMSTVETQGEAPLDLNLTKPPPPTHANKQPSRAIEQSAKIMAE